MRALSYLVFGALFLAGCGGDGGGGKTEDVDSDGDGLMDAEEASLGTDPAVADSDADGLADGAEVTAGTDPLATDSDGDTYSDFDETTEGTDPLDPESRIYTGYWPYNPNKGDIEDPGWDQGAKEGRTLPNFVYVDQFGQEVSIYDYAGHGKPVVVDASAEWCSYCQELAKLLEGRRSYFDGYWPDLKDLVDNGDVLWVTVLAEDTSGNSDTSSTDAAATRWADKFKHDKIAVLGDDKYQFFGYEGVNGFPWLLMVDENMEIISFDGRSNNMAPLDVIEDMYANGEIGTAE